jgi:hypothetical protein
VCGDARIVEAMLKDRSSATPPIALETLVADVESYLRKGG